MWNNASGIISFMYIQKLQKKIMNTAILVRVVPFLVEKAMALHSSTLAWKIPWTEEPGRLQSMGSLRIGHE